MRHTWPAALRGKHAPLDFERMLGVPGTARSLQVVARLRERMASRAGAGGR